jgi:sulfite reductase (ferredoxin)
MEGPNMSEASQALKRSALEDVKESSRQLRGTIAQELAGGVDHLSDAAKNLLKFHGSYQQEDRDARKNRAKAGVGKHYMFMVRCKVPGGKVTADQYLAVDELAGRYANGTLRFTTRQGIQLHGVLKGDLQPAIKGINDSLLTTLGACGDVNRNVMACPAPTADPARRELQKWAAVVAREFAPRTTAYHDIWLNGEPVGEPSEVDEPIYGKAYLPRKFKTGFALQHDNCVDVFAQDLGFLAAVEGGRVVGYDVLAGGSMGMTHGNATTFPQVARHVCWIKPDQVLDAAVAMITLFRDHGNRADRKRARLKYLVHDLGTEGFRELYARYLPFPLVPPRGLRATAVDLHLGWHPQGDGKYFYGLSVENGRVKDDGDLRLRTGLRAIVQRFQPALRITPHQDVLLCGLPADAEPELYDFLERHGIPRPERVSPVRQHSLACPAIPTCGLALSEAERVLPGMITALEQELARLGLARERISVRMTGCPNGCARPYQSDIGIVGRSGSKYTVYVGGGVLGDRLNDVLKDLVPAEQIVTTLRPVLELFKSQRRPDEGFGDFCQRYGMERLRELVGAAPEAHARAG